VVVKRKQAEDLEHLARAADRFGDALQKLANVNPPADRTPTEHPELQRLARNFDRATQTVEKAVAATFMTAAQYGRIAGNFEAIAEGMKGGAAKESAAEKRRATPGRRVAAPAVRKRRRRR
jgi:hypothetical protein